MPEELPDLESERLERTYKELHTSQFFLGYVVIAFVFSSVLFLKALLVLLNALPYAPESTFVTLLEVFLTFGLLFEIGWVVKFAQIDNYINVKNEQFRADAIIGLVALCLLIVNNFVHDSKVVNCLLHFIWWGPIIARSGLLAKKSYALSSLEAQKDAHKSKGSSVLPSISPASLAVPVARSLVLSKIGK